MPDLTPFFEPKVVAVVGANRERNKIGSEILHNLLHWADLKRARRFAAPASLVEPGLVPHEDPARPASGVPVCDRAALKELDTHEP